MSRKLCDTGPLTAGQDRFWLDTVILIRIINKNNNNNYVAVRCLFSGEDKKDIKYINNKYERKGNGTSHDQIT